MLKRFSDISINDVAMCGGKGASLGELLNAGLPIPNGFVLTTEAYGKDINEWEEDVLQAFDKLSTKFVAVRSSGTKEDGTEDSFAGQFDTYLFVTRENLVSKIKECHDSVSSERIKSYCEYKGIDINTIKVAVVVQKMVNSDSAGVCFTINPVTNNRDEIMIEAGLGVGEAVVSGIITPDNYVVNKKTGDIKAVISQQEKKLMISDKGGTKEVDIPVNEQKIQKLSDKNIKLLAELAKKIEKHYGKPMDTEWAVENDKLFMLQARPITTIAENEKNDTIFKLINVESDSSLLTLCMQLKGVTSRKIEGLIGIPPLKMILQLRKWNSSDALIDKDYTEGFAHGCANILLNNINIAKDLLKRTKKICSEIKNLGNEYKNKVQNLTVDELVLLLKKVEEIEMNALLIGTPFAFADVLGDITNKIKDIVYSKKSLSEDPSEYINILSSPKELSDTKLAYNEIGRLGNDKSKKKYLLDKYYRLDQGYIGKGLTENELNLLIEKNRNNENNDKITYDSLYKEINLSPEEEAYFELSRIIIEGKSLRGDARQFCFVIANKIVERIAKERGVSEEILNCMTCDELIEYIKNNILPRGVSERLKGAIVTISYDKKQKIKILTGNKLSGFEKKYIYHEEIKKSNTLNGQVAFHGKYTGKVKLIFSPDDNNKINPGDILVASTTTPQLLPAMVKAGAFITEIGGITSHAAIIAREMKKPCIVGVSHVMQLLEDNMYVELDTDNGTINIIKDK